MAGLNELRLAVMVLVIGTTASNLTSSTDHQEGRASYRTTRSCGTAGGPDLIVFGDSDISLELDARVRHAWGSQPRLCGKI